jgi:hypothetical protein
MDHRGRTMTLFFLDEIIPVAPCDPNGGQMHVIVPRGLGACAGIVVGAVMDTVAFCEILNIDPAPVHGIRGTALIGNRQVRFLDMEQVSKWMETLIRRRV